MTVYGFAENFYDDKDLHQAAVEWMAGCGADISKIPLDPFSMESREDGRWLVVFDIIDDDTWCYHGDAAHKLRHRGSWIADTLPPQSLLVEIPHRFRHDR